MTSAQRKEIRERTHLEIAVSAAIAAGLADDERIAAQDMERIIEQHMARLKTWWLRERGGGIRGWLCFLRSYGFEERLEARRIEKDAKDQPLPHKGGQMSVKPAHPPHAAPGFGAGVTRSFAS
jgi:hypothetical protein